MSIISLIHGVHYFHYSISWILVFILYQSNTRVILKASGNIVITLLIVFLFLHNQFESLVFFSEPSHLIIFLTPLLVQLVSTSKTSGIIVLILYGMLFLSIKSAIGALLFVLLCIVRFRWKAVIAITGTLAIIGTSFFGDYYVSRLTFGDDIQNISTLVILQAYEIAFEVIMNVKLFGYHPSRITELMSGAFSLQLQKVYGGLKHAEDGGIALTHGLVYYGYTFLFFLSVVVYRLRSRFKHYLPFVVAACIELFVRGMGLFTLSLMYLWVRSE